jgi:hypothetical protein
MSDNIYAPPQSSGIVPQTLDKPMFYIVSKQKFSVLFVATLGLYAVYWFYKNWSSYKDNVPLASTGSSTIWPVPRAIFSVFFIHALFREVKAYGEEKSEVAAWSDNAHATTLVVLIVLSNAFDRLANKAIGSPATDILALLFIVPLLFQYRKAQEMINIACNDTEGASNSAFTLANYAWIVVGVIFWLLVAMGLFFPQQ